VVISLLKKEMFFSEDSLIQKIKLQQQTMKWNISFNEEEKILFINIEGVLTLTAKVALLHEVSPWLTRHNCSRCLLDYRNIESVCLSTVEIYDLPQKYEEADIPRKTMMAFVVPQNYEEDFKFYETVFRNQGYRMSVFYDYEMAVRLLKQMQGYVRKSVDNNKK
jgi:hypothetical protein